MNENMANVNKSSQLSAEEQSNNYGFVTKKAREIQDSVKQKDNFIIDSLLAPGLTILAGPRKGGKSWLVFDMALHIVCGEDFWGRKTTKGDVLYMALEDDDKRIKRRLNTLLDDDDAPEGLDFTYQINRKEKLAAGLDRYLSDHKDTKVVIIDVLQKIRTGKKPAQSEYEHDYEELTGIKNIADKHQAAILVVTHVRKTKDNSDWVNNICGGVGVTGVADTIMGLFKQEKAENRSFMVTSRDLPEMNMAIKFEQEHCQWKYVGTEEELNVINEEDAYKASPVVKTVKSLLDKNGGKWEGTCTELMQCGMAEVGAKIAKSPAALSRKINNFNELMLKDHIVHTMLNKDGGGCGRIHIFQKEDEEDFLQDFNAEELVNRAFPGILSGHADLNIA